VCSRREDPVARFFERSTRIDQRGRRSRRTKAGLAAKEGTQISKHGGCKLAYRDTRTWGDASLQSVVGGNRHSGDGGELWRLGSSSSSSSSSFDDREWYFGRGD
jgi:hypothetical protein